MKAIRIHEAGGPEVLKYENCPDPTPGPGTLSHPKPRHTGAGRNVDSHFKCNT